MSVQQLMLRSQLLGPHPTSNVQWLCRGGAVLHRLPSALLFHHPLSPPASTQLRIGYCQPSPPPSPADPQNTRQLMPLAQHSAEHAYHIFVHRFKRMCQQARERRPSIIINDVSTSLRMIPLGQSRRAESLQPAWSP
ncbi:hypothetical protein FRB95_008372 [Tulasnella sp. JGI-2019a]|nr:hypothetical protein FRB95_008372 [Tulasnella sp. JGI-2019a]